MEQNEPLALEPFDPVKFGQPGMRAFMADGDGQHPQPVRTLLTLQNPQRFIADCGPGNEYILQWTSDGWAHDPGEGGDFWFLYMAQCGPLVPFSRELWASGKYEAVVRDSGDIEYPATVLGLAPEGCLSPVAVWWEGRRGKSTDLFRENGYDGAGLACLMLRRVKP